MTAVQTFIGLPDYAQAAITKEGVLLKVSLAITEDLIPIIKSRSSILRILRGKRGYYIEVQRHLTHSNIGILRDVAARLERKLMIVARLAKVELLNSEIENLRKLI